MELEPCPLCRSTDVLVWKAPEDARGVGCNECGVSLQRATEAEAIAAWNRRPEGGQAGGTLENSGSDAELSRAVPAPAEDQGSSRADIAAIPQEAGPEGSEVAGWADISTAPRVLKGKTWEMRFWLPLPADHGAAGGASSAPAKVTPDEHVPAPAGEVGCKPVKMLVDQDWLSRHVVTDPDADVEVRPPPAAGEVEPVAWGFYGPNGTIQLCTHDRGWAEAAAATWGLTAEPLYPASALTALQAERDRLREALRETLEMAELFVPTKLDAPGFKRARAALEGR